MDKKLLKFLCRDKRVKQAHKEGKDLYSTIASMIFGCSYEECLEFNNLIPNLIGKRRRQVAKFLVASFYFGDFEYCDYVSAILRDLGE